MECDKKIKNRIQRSKGQMNGVVQMIEEKKSCQEVLIQLLAIRSSIDKVIGCIVTNNIEGILSDQGVDIDDETLQQALSMIVKIK